MRALRCPSRYYLPSSCYIPWSVSARRPLRRKLYPFRNRKLQLFMFTDDEARSLGSESKTMSTTATAAPKKDVLSTPRSPSPSVRGPCGRSCFKSNQNQIKSYRLSWYYLTAKMVEDSGKNNATTESHSLTDSRTISEGADPTHARATGEHPSRWSLF